MCGIAGIIFKQDALIDANFIAAATNKIHRRGPDHQATFIDHQVHFGHRRLSILDTSEAAHQPMTDTSGNYTIIFNGEIFNFKTIKAVLMSKGYEFSYYRRYGSATLCFY
jgi:asparagine synthase (glutamine-hydrolysing)